MNRAERRRSAKNREKNPRTRKEKPPRVPDVRTIKSHLQQAPSPQNVEKYIGQLVEQGLPAAGADELIAYAAQYHETRARLNNPGKEIEVLLETSHAWADDRIEQSQARGDRACAPGCGLCCHLPLILAGAAEVVYLADWLKDNLADDQLEKVKQRLKAKYCADSSPCAPDTRSPCVLLEDSKCLAYDARPFKCRAWNSLSLRACESAYGDGESPAQVPVDTYAFVMGNSILNGFSDAVDMEGLDGGAYELGTALLRALEMPNGAARWRNGERLFTAVDSE